MLNALILLAVAAVPQQRQSLGILLDHITKTTGILVVAVPVLAKEQVPGPTESLTAQNIEPFLKQLVAKMPIPSVLVKLNLPPPPKGKAWTADELIAYGLAESKLFRKPIGEPKSDVVEILAQPLPPDKARLVVEALELKPVYVIMLKHGYFGGTWQTTYGEMRLEQKGNKVTGTYTTGNGTITGLIVGDEMRFQWFEQSSGTGGFGVFKMAQDGMSFAGPWHNDTNIETPAGTWTGTRIR